MEIIGRITANAQRKELTDGREVVNFSIAINDSYKPRGATEIKKVVTYIDCSYWLSAGISPFLKKGVIVQLSGSISARAWNDMQGEAKASLNFHVNSIKLHGGGKKSETISEPPTENNAPPDDLPF
jgi:single-strand DNA-binding protein